MKKTKLSIILVSYNTRSLLKRCLESLYENAPKSEFEVIVVDNNSHDASVEMLEKYFKKRKNFKIVKNKVNLGFAGGNNAGISRTNGEYILFLNSDTHISKNIFDEMIRWMDENPEVGAASCALKNEDGSIQPTGGFFPTLTRVASWMLFQDLPFVDRLAAPFHPDTEFYKQKRDLDWITGAFFLTRKNILKKIGGFDDEYFMYTEDVDLCYRIKDDGWKVNYLPRWSIVHYGGASSTKEFAVLSEFNGVKLFFAKHRPRWQYYLLRLLLKLGALARLVINPKTYAKALLKA